MILDTIDASLFVSVTKNPLSAFRANQRAYRCVWVTSLGFGELIKTLRLVTNRAQEFYNLGARAATTLDVSWLVIAQCSLSVLEDRLAHGVKLLVGEGSLHTKFFAYLTFDPKSCPISPMAIEL